RFGIEEGKRLPYPLVEYFLKNDKLGDPLVTEDHILAFEWADQVELDEMAALALRVNDFCAGLFMGVGLRLIDFKLEFGRLYQDGYMSIILADEISPDNCRLWDTKTGDKLDKDRFRQDLGNISE